MSSDCPQCDKEMSRRVFLTWFASISMGVTALFSTVMVGRAVVPPGRSVEGKTKVGSLAVARVDELEIEEPVLAEYGDDVLFLVKRSETEVDVWDAACPHVACKLAWNEGSKEFDCPCHASSFDIDGVLLGGPAPRDMIAAENEIVDGEVIVSGFTA